ncbi:hypothetical protein GCM10022402_25480 [Salinactinospora qingdaonensis]|uniref:Uncharacterized protein n=1 Tax=Salinactinospora qingdaonensis TaxID=702744 RepID=A0ABP7FVC1_9ACTN
MTEARENSSHQPEPSHNTGDVAYPAHPEAESKDRSHAPPVTASRNSGEMNVTYEFQVVPGQPGRELQAEQTHAIKDVLEWVLSTRSENPPSPSTPSDTAPPTNPPSDSKDS